MRIRFSDGSIYDQPGQINFVDVSVDRATDTVTGARDRSQPARAC